MAILIRGQQIDKYTVQSLIKENLYTETYRVEDEDGNPFFMKVFVTKRMPEKLINTENGTVFEIEYCQRMKQKNIVSFIGSGTFNYEDHSRMFDEQAFVDGVFNDISFSLWEVV